MPKRMLIDASHPEETRVVVIDGQRVDEFDFEAASKRPLKGNIYLAKVTRVEPSLQAAFVEYGGNRQGFLAFSEIHPDYYQIPVADRQALIAEQQEEARRRADDEFESVATGVATGNEGEPAEGEETTADASDDTAEPHAADDMTEERSDAAEIERSFDTGESELDETPGDAIAAEEFQADDSSIEFLAEEETEEDIVDQQTVAEAAEIDARSAEHHALANSDLEPEVSWDIVDQQSVGDDVQPVTNDENAMPAEPESDGRPAQPLRSSRPPQRWVRKRHYKIQEVIKRKQIMLVQVVKEERGTKGAALTTYLSLAGRYCVLMPNTPRGGGISRKITNAVDRNRLKSAAATLELPEGMGLIIRTAGANRTKLEIKRDYEYLLRMWDQIRELTLKSNAPACVYEEGDIVKRAIRDLYNKDVSEILVEGDEGYKNAKEFMRMLMPSHAKNVKPYRDPTPLFQSHHIEAQLDAMFQPTVTLKSGGYIVMNQTEALVSIDVNSGRATREHSIEETAHKTNLEAADEIGRQLRLRDLAGLIVIDFIDMEDSRNDRDVEKRIRDAVKHDRARVQIGKISQFGLLEMSRQRLRAGVVASSTIPCPHCGGQGIVLSVESSALRVLRALDEEGQRGRTAAVTVRVANDVALYTLNQKRRELARIENDYTMSVSFEPTDNLMAGHFDLDRTAQHTQPQPSPQKLAITAAAAFETPTDLAEPVAEDEEEPVELEQLVEASTNGDGGQPQPGAPNGTKKRRRRRRGRGGSKAQTAGETTSLVATPEPSSDHGAVDHAAEHPPVVSGSNGAQGEGAHAESVLPSGNGQQPSSAPRRRRRRRRKPSGTTSSTQDVGKSSAHDHERGAFEGEETVAPNAPSDPVWGFGSDRAAAVEEKVAAPIGQTYYRREEVSVAEIPKQDSSRKSEPQDVSPPVSQASTAHASGSEAEKPQRRGWWQRAFKS
jgi:ribonuclease E